MERRYLREYVHVHVGTRSTPAESVVNSLIFLTVAQTISKWRVSHFPYFPHSELKRPGMLVTYEYT